MFHQAGPVTGACSLVVDSFHAERVVSRDRFWLGPETVAVVSLPGLTNIPGGVCRAGWGKGGGGGGGVLVPDTALSPPECFLHEAGQRLREPF